MMGDDYEMMMGVLLKCNGNLPPHYQKIEQPIIISPYMSICTDNDCSSVVMKCVHIFNRWGEIADVALVIEKVIKQQ